MLHVCLYNYILYSILQETIPVLNVYTAYCVTDYINDPVKNDTEYKKCIRPDIHTWSCGYINIIIHHYIQTCSLAKVCISPTAFGVHCMVNVP